MKRIILTLSALCAFAPMAAALGGPTTPTAEQFQSTMTIVSLRISSQTSQATELTQYLESGDMGWRTLWLQSLDLGNAIYCDEQASVCKAEGTSCAGWRIPDISSQTYSMQYTMTPGQHLYCVCASASAGCNASMIRGR